SFFCSATAPTEIYPLSLHDALPISLMVGLSVLGHAQLAVDTALAREAAAIPGSFRSAVIVANPRAADATVRMNFVKSDGALALADRKSTRLNSSHVEISYAVFCLKK